MEVGVVEGDKVFGVDFVGEGVTTDVVGAFRPQFIVGVDVSDDDGVVVEERR